MTHANVETVRPGPDTRGLLEAASSMVPALTERARLVDAQGALPQRTVVDLVGCGFPGTSTPARFGGSEQGVAVQHEISWQLARGCGSTAWCNMVWMAHSGWLAHFPRQSQEEVFAHHAPPLICGNINPAFGRAVAAPGGYRLSGHWKYVSGCEAAAWAIVACGSDRSDMLWFLLAAPDYRVTGDWDVMGLRGTASRDIVVEDLFVPAHRSMDPNERPAAADCGAPDLPTQRLFNGWSLAAPVIGMAQGMLDACASTIDATGDAAAELAGASAALDAMRAFHKSRVAGILDRAAGGRLPEPRDSLLSKRDACHVVDTCLRTADRLFRLNGAAAISAASPIQRHYRDILAASRHTTFNLRGVSRALAEAEGDPSA